MLHLKRILQVVVPVLAVAATSIAVSPAAQHFAADHPGLVAYIALGAGVARAVYAAIMDAKTAAQTPGPGSSSTMAAK